MHLVEDGTETGIARVFEDRIAGGVAPGSYVAVFDRDRVRFSRGFGEITRGGDVPDEDTLFRIASCTKSFTAAVLLILRDTGRLDLDAPVDEFVPEFAPITPGGVAVRPTVRMLLTMSGGLGTDDPWADRQESITLAEFRRLLVRGVRCVTVPGTAFAYSNLGYALLGQVIERVTGGRFVDAVTSLLLEPLGLGAVFERPDRERPEDGGAVTAIGHRVRRDRAVDADDRFVEVPFSGPGVFSAIGGLFASATTMIGWVRWLDAAWTGDESGPLSSASRREMQQLQRLSPPRPSLDGLPPRLALGYGFGLFVEEDAALGTLVSHSGGYPGYSAHMRWHPASGIGVVAFENAGYAAVAKPAEQVLRLAIADAQSSGELAEPVIRPWPETLVASMTATGLLSHWDDRVAASLFAENVALDVPLDERRTAAEAAVAAVGGIAEVASGRATPVCDSPDHLVWFVEGERGRLRLEVRLTPVLPLRVQTFTVTVDHEALETTVADD
ncbi:serine hydrolase domain-containing protein [Plantibacter sp. LMC-P-059a]|uniref:serine hydrolase domain-containing protein n=1 Tax=Plantibacter sp. LMC-P-059a TaxID=3040297 RepID=UPI00254D568D|nr:serine hydrolase domain-containing protein [Plantibacter sp. LMC-P-059a]